MANPQTQLDDMTLAELHDRAKEDGLTGTSHMRKEELVKAIEAGSSKNDATDGSNADTKASSKSDVTETSDKGDQSLDGMSLAELHEKAKEDGLTGTSHMRKEELIEAIQSGSSAHEGPAHRASGDRKRDENGHFEKSDAGETGDKKSSKAQATTHDATDRPRDDKGHFEKTTDKKSEGEKASAKH